MLKELVPQCEFERVRAFVELHRAFIDRIRQLPLESEFKFINFCCDLGIRREGVTAAIAEGAVRVDGVGTAVPALFHRFRMYPALEYGRWPTEGNESPHRFRNGVVDLAILLEPFHWQFITWQRRLIEDANRDDFDQTFESFRCKIQALLRSLDVSAWASAHAVMRRESAQVDANSRVYALLRASLWERRRELTGTLGQALWVRHVAEVIRLGFEAAIPALQWPEEDDALGSWQKGGRTYVFGTERPFDDVLVTKPYIASHFGLFTGSKVRWYVEGKTELGAIRELMGSPMEYGVEVVDLKGVLASRDPTAALRLPQLLQQDRHAKRFSLLSFDKDVVSNVDAIRRLIRAGLFIGKINANNPDFEFANFTLSELVELAATYDEARGHSGDSVRGADWTSASAKPSLFAAHYEKVSARQPQSLKGEEWGIHLARYAKANPDRPDTFTSRPIIKAVAQAMRGWNSDYDAFAGTCTFDDDLNEVGPTI